MQKLTVFMEPVAKGRPRSTITKNGKILVYTPSKTVHAENLIRDKALEAFKPFEPGVPLFMSTTFYFQRRKSAKKAILPVKRPDDENCMKLVMDALESFAYPNDSQITTCVIKKRYGDPPRIEIEIGEDTVAEERNF